MHVRKISARFKTQPATTHLAIFKSGEAYKKSMFTLEGGDIKEGLILFSDAMKIYIIMIVVFLAIGILLSITFIFGGLMFLSQLPS